MSNAKRYAVTDKGGKVVNHILLDDPLPKGYWPGYGAYLLPLEPVDTKDGGAALDVINFDKWPVLPQIGDTIDLNTGEVTKFVPTLVAVPTDDKGGTMTVASAPQVKLATDEQPKAEGTITDKVSTGIK